MKVYGLSNEQKGLYNRAISGAMTPPVGAVTNKGRTRWVETFLVDSVEFEPDVEIKNASPEDTTGVVRIVLIVDPSSAPFDAPSPNLAHRHQESLYFNWSAYENDPGSRLGHSMMTKMSIDAFGSFLVALGFSVEDGMQPGEFCALYGTEIIGKKVNGVVVQKANEERGLSDEVRRFVAVDA